jgi:hypothetical protein
MFLLHLLNISFDIAHLSYSDISMFVFCSTAMLPGFEIGSSHIHLIICIGLYSLRTGLILALVV